MNSYSFLAVCVSTFFYAGNFPLIPGTLGSAIGLAIFFLVKNDVFLYFFITALLLTAGFLFTGKAEKALNKKDARCIIMDEASGMLLSLIFLPYDFKLMLVGFFLFRLFDTLKPFPAGRLQKLKGSAGIMADDIAASVYTNICLHIFLRLASITGS
ncbi:MAG: phosphatidylglycerophosphatase A [Candidatus Omnitrophota bacterium]